MAKPRQHRDSNHAGRTVAGAVWQCAERRAGDRLVSLAAHDRYTSASIPSRGGRLAAAMRRAQRVQQTLAGHFDAVLAVHRNGRFGPRLSLLRPRSGPQPFRALPSRNARRHHARRRFSESRRGAAATTLPSLFHAQRASEWFAGSECRKRRRARTPKNAPQNAPQRPETALAYHALVRSYADELLRRTGAKHVHMELIEHDFPSPQEFLDGHPLNDPSLYRKVADLGTFPEPATPTRSVSEGAVGARAQTSP